MQRSIENVPRAASRPSRIPLLASKANGNVAIDKENIVENRQTNHKVTVINKRGIKNVPLVTNGHQGFKIHQNVNCDTCNAGNAANDQEKNEETLDWLLTAEGEILKEVIMNIPVFPEFIDKGDQNELSVEDEETLNLIRKSEEFIENIPVFSEFIYKEDDNKQSDEETLNWLIRKSEEFIETLAPDFPEVIGKEDEIVQSDEDMLLEYEEDLQELDPAHQETRDFNFEGDFVRDFIEDIEGGFKEDFRNF